jgi:F-type H+-transporting ATPase subunit c
MDVTTATLIAGGLKYIGAGLATLGMIGLGILFGNYYVGALRNPSAAKTQQTNLFIGMALTEALGIFAFVIALLILFNKPSL